MFTQDYALGSRVFGPVGQHLEAMRFDPGLLRPYKVTINGRDYNCVTVNTGRSKITTNSKTGKQSVTPVYEEVRVSDLPDSMRSPVHNATALRKEEWLQLDQVALRAARRRLRAWSDLAKANSYGGFNGMAKMILEHETLSDPGEAMVDMDGLSEGRSDEPQAQLQGLPLPITHSDYWMSSRKLAISRNSGTPLDTTMGEAAARRVAESIEKVTIGVNQGITYGGNSTQVGGYGRANTVYGYTNFTPRLTYTHITAPTAGGWTPASTLASVLAMRDQLYANKFYGPFMLYTSNDWDQYLDNDYWTGTTAAGIVAPSKTLRTRLREIEDITDVRRLDFLFSANVAASTGPGGEYFTATGTSPFQMIMVQMTQEVARAVTGMDITTVQWESVGGMRLNFKVMAIMVPQLRADFYGNAGLCTGTTA